MIWNCWGSIVFINLKRAVENGEHFGIELLGQLFNALQRAMEHRKYFDIELLE